MEDDPYLRWAMSIAVQSFELPPIGTQCYVVSNTETQEMAVFDAPLNAWATVEALAAKSGYRVSGLYLTHGHWDHTLDGQKFNLASVPTFAHAEDRLFYETPEIMATFSVPGLEMPPVEIGTWLEDGQRITIVGRTVEVRHVPGHSPGSILFWFVDDKVAISGDALFSGSIGRTDFPGCSFEQLANSIKKQIYTLPDDTTVYPGHGPETSVGQEAVRNPFVTR
jgi:glyoxylase-like metal-dependent hydrolase (beta-lactamase superfamily II)